MKTKESKNRLIDIKNDETALYVIAVLQINNSGKILLLADVANGAQAAIKQYRMERNEILMAISAWDALFGPIETKADEERYKPVGSEKESIRKGLSL